MNNAVKNVVEFLNLPLEEVVKMASINVAKNIGVDKMLGSITVGKRADFVILDKNLNVIKTIRNGQVIYTR